MKTVLITLLSCATLCLAQDMKMPPPAQAAPRSQAAPPEKAPLDKAAPDSQEFKRLASVTWDLNSHKLVWVVERGPEVDGKFVAKQTDRYEVSPNEAFMALRDEKRDIGGDEASSLHDLLSVLSLYCVESTVWWERGPDSGGDGVPSFDAKPAPGSPNGKSAPSAKPKADPDGKPARVDQPEKKPVQLIPGARIAEAPVAMK